MGTANQYITEYNDFIAKRDASPCNKHAQEIATIWVEEGKEAALKRLNEIVTQFKMKQFEFVVLSNRIQEILINNGYHIKTLPEKRKEVLKEKISEMEIKQWMSTGMTRQEAIKEIEYWCDVTKRGTN